MGARRRHRRRLSALTGPPSPTTRPAAGGRPRPRSCSSATGGPGGGSELSVAAAEEWTGVDVSVAEIEAELARLREASAQADGSSRQRTSVMTHIAWVPPEWLDLAERTLQGMEARHPSRTVILVPEVASDGGIDAELAVRCFPVGDREICGEVIELRLRGDRASAPASIVVPLAIADLPLFLRWRGEPPFGSNHWHQADRARRPRHRRLLGVGRAALRRAGGRVRAVGDLGHRLGPDPPLAGDPGAALAGDPRPGDRGHGPPGRGGAPARLAGRAPGSRAGAGGNR